MYGFYVLYYSNIICNASLIIQDFLYKTKLEFGQTSLAWFTR